MRREGVGELPEPEREESVDPKSPARFFVADSTVGPTIASPRSSNGAAPSQPAGDVLNPADIPGSLKSSGGGCEVGPGGVFVVAGVGFQAAMQDADEPVG